MSQGFSCSLPVVVSPIVNVQALLRLLSSLPGDQYTYELQDVKAIQSLEAILTRANRFQALKLYLSRTCLRQVAIRSRTF